MTDQLASMSRPCAQPMRPHKDVSVSSTVKTYDCQLCD